MAYKAPDVDGQVSEWNEAMFKMKRLHELQEEINRCNMMPLIKHPIAGEWNYIILFRSICSLYSEGNAKYKEVELTELNELKDTIISHMKNCPVHKSASNAGYGGGTKQDVYDDSNWDMLRRLLEKMEFLVRKYNDTHGLSTKNAESMDGRSILR